MTLRRDDAGPNSNPGPLLRPQSKVSFKLLALLLHPQGRGQAGRQVGRACLAGWAHYGAGGVRVFACARAGCTNDSVRRQIRASITAQFLPHTHTPISINVVLMHPRQDSSFLSRTRTRRSLSLTHTHTHALSLSLSLSHIHTSSCKVHHRPWSEELRSGQSPETMTCGGVHCHHHHPSVSPYPAGNARLSLLSAAPHLPSTSHIHASYVQTNTHTRSRSLSLSQSQYLSSEYDPKRNQEKHALSLSYHRQTLPQGCFCFGGPFLC
ncbi:hypothetical protein LZ31DRAFT_223719 [Colletotrichum somersetense]|nr:hypothetical protein LZ31DRAFT_223719 [Colletotrichum somersetense]